MNKERTLNPIKNNPQSRNNHHFGQGKNQFLSPNKKSQSHQVYSECKPRSNVIKINRAKLPADFFPKCFSFQKRLPQFKLNINQQEQQAEKGYKKSRRVQSQRLHISPEKTSFFGFFEQENPSLRQLESRTLAVKRKFETREEPKRDNSELKRRFTPGSNMHRNQLLELFPATYEQHVTEIVTSNSSARVHKVSPRKEYQSKYQQLVYDPEKADCESMSLPLNNKLEPNFLNNQSKTLINLKTIQTLEQFKPRPQLTFTKPQTLDLHNMTFFNAKSTALPPIKKL